MNWPLMRENVTHEDIHAFKEFLDRRPNGEIPRLTQGDQVAAFESEFAAWLGVKHAVMVNSGASANLITIAALQYPKGSEIIVPTITWVSDIAAVLHAGYKPVFVDIDPRTLSMDSIEVFKKITFNTRAVFLTHTLGFNGLSESTVERLRGMKIELIEDCCESLGATMFGGKSVADPLGDTQKLGTFGLASNFSFYYAHHMSTIEGGMICTDNENLYNRLRMLRSHGLVRECNNTATRLLYANQYPDLDPQFIFSQAGYNVRSTELNAVLGRSQLRRVDDGNARRTENLTTWLGALGPAYRTDYRTEGSSNYALPLVLKEMDPTLMDKVIACLQANGVEYRRGTAGGGNQLRQPYLKHLRIAKPEDFPETEHVHKFGLYIGNYPSLKTEQIVELCEKLNALVAPRERIYPVDSEHLHQSFMEDESCSTQTAKPTQSIVSGIFPTRPTDTIYWCTCGQPSLFNGGTCHRCNRTLTKTYPYTSV